MGDSNATAGPQSGDVLEHLRRLEAKIDLLVRERTVKDRYTTTEVAELLGRAAFTVREWCRAGRLEAQKAPCGRGRDGEWLISREELQRYRNEGLRPITRS